MNEITLDVKIAKTKIDRNIYGHFAEHLGRCIYEGFWVGEDSPIPNVNGIRHDVVAALRKIKVPVLRWPGGCFADEYHWMDGIGHAQQAPDDDQHPLGRCGREQLLWHPRVYGAVRPTRTASPMSAAMWAAARCRRCRSGSSI